MLSKTVLPQCRNTTIFANKTASLEQKIVDDIQMQRQSLYFVLRRSSLRIINHEIQFEDNRLDRDPLIMLRERLDTPEALMAAIEGYQHLPIDVLSQFLLDHYTVDLDVLAELAETLDGRQAASTRTVAQSAA
ncbi:hypothetical protein ACFQEX_08735 [Roseibium salinum]|uniref:hypothetical protein n=1 Tax=Roseibium salinum TaxID=1604349 RepID=UPI003616F255